MKTGTTCPSCQSETTREVFEARGVPVNSVLLLPTREEALDFPTGDISLRHCPACDFVFNAAFDGALTEYSGRYEETQGFSPTFQRWHRSLAERLVERHDLRGKTILEIGCGKGEFLALLCELGDNRGVGFDPAYRPERDRSAARGRTTVHRAFYSEQHADVAADFVVCKMTLEHIPDTLAFVSMLRRALAGRPGTTVFFQVPDAERVVDEAAFWDVYYEHCSYFGARSLAGLFRRAGFTVLDVQRTYDGQYLTLESRPDGPAVAAADDDDARDGLGERIGRFGAAVTAARATWGGRIRDAAAAGRKTVLWGGGSKGVAFLTTLGLAVGAGVDFVVDINPYKWDHYMAGTGQRLVGPDFLTEYRPDAVVVMNPVYTDEIRALLSERGLTPELLSL